MSMQIAAGSSGRCVASAISTMRLALGYRKGLPTEYKHWADATNWPTTDEFIQSLPDLFPDRKILMWFNLAEDASPLLTDMFWCGPVLTIEHTRIYLDTYLFAFIYTAGLSADGSSVGHIVIGTPTENLASAVTLTFAVSLDKTRGRK